MTPSRSRGWAVLRNLAVPALALAVVATVPFSSPDSAESGQAADAWTPMSPVSVTYEQASYGTGARTAKGNLLGFNDFHGAVDPPTGSGGLVNGTPAGGVEYLTTWIKRLRTEAKAERRESITVGAGDLVGATPLVSAAFHDEPSIELLNNAGLQISSVGNHEFDEGTTELQRLQRGGCHPVDGCQDGDGFKGAKFNYLAANVVRKNSGLPLLLPVDIRLVDGVPVGFVGMTLKGTPSIVNPAGITSVEFRDEIETANKWGGLLRLAGVKSLVLLIHEGGAQSAPPTPQPVDGCANFAGPITNIVAGLRPEFGIVVSGHTHRFYSCQLPNSSGAPTVVTSAGSNGVLVTDIDFTLDKRSGRFAEIAARNVIVENGVRNPDGSWQTDVTGAFVRNPALVDASAKTIADKYRTAVAPIANRLVGKITADITNAANAAGESALGDVIADAQLAYTTSAGAQIALMNPGGIRAPLTYANSPGGEAPGDVTYGECFTVQPFNNLVVTQTLTGAQIKEVLEQQFVGFGGQTVQRILQPSVGFTYSYNSTAAAGSKVSNIALNGTPIDPAATYRVTTNDFLANGGDGFTRLTAGTDRTTAPGFDIDALVAYLGGGTPVAPGPQNRITKTA
ncbi:bifunctional metallophosphatase/5'-nucleotidase [Phytohabitans houttuyneae]|uniref:Bifunctional metallophosphatase/5'-nucleotidase n=1 Tax=Phytohabitans houttuyneae TaxID=1076126 RepID=A0A6V8K5U9_9ACTN|nr:bifunctional metallophosphatase/5'-nucleotidase [Phytohabitans houttuyneae]GFJ78880.1 bifunctional metallophosphatase/5'-nucleotidase [Phytohabitans houttuyneae]